LNISDLSPYINRLDIIRQTAEQIIKDFNIVGIEITFSGDPYSAYSELYCQIEPEIDKLLKFNKLNSLLYRIDISEAQINKTIKNNPVHQLSRVITDLIIKRELQKVVIRSHYSK